jgi:MazG family protein
MRKATFEDLLALVRRLRGEGGCEWDRAQTSESLLPYLLEEAYEVREVILEGRERERELAGELGDLALHVAFQTVLAEERGTLDVVDVFGAVLDKMIRRHPHIFGSAGGNGEPRERVAQDEAAESPRPPPWEELKRRERAPATGPARTLDGIPRALPALLKAQRLQERAADVGFDWPDARGAMEKVREELGELERRIEPSRDSARLEEELGDLLFAVVNLARKSGVGAEAALERASAKFKRRFERVEELAAERGLDVASAGLAALDALWDEVKLGEGREARG